VAQLSKLGGETFMPSQPSSSSVKFHCYVSVMGVIGAFVGWNLWFVSGGWQRQQHWGESMLWAAHGASSVKRLEAISLPFAFSTVP
jgi:hypothetical protein